MANTPHKISIRGESADGSVVTVGFDYAPWSDDPVSAVAERWSDAVNGRKETAEAVDSPSASDAIRLACYEVEGWAETSSADLADAITKARITTAPGLGAIMDAAVAYATDSNGDGEPASPVTEDQALADLELLETFTVTRRAEEAILNGAHADLVRNLKLAKARYKRITSASMNDAVAGGLQHAIDTYGQSLVEKTAGELGIEPPSSVSASDVDAALGRA